MTPTKPLPELNFLDPEPMTAPDYGHISVRIDKEVYKHLHHISPKTGGTSLIVRYLLTHVYNECLKGNILAYTDSDKLVVLLQSITAGSALALPDGKKPAPNVRGGTQSPRGKHAGTA